MSSPADTAIEAFLAEPKNIIVAGIRRDGRPHVSPNWFFWDGEKFYVSTTRKRAKYNIFRRDPRVELVIDDPADRRYIGLSGTVEVREDIPATCISSAASTRSTAAPSRRTTSTSPA